MTPKTKAAANPFDALTDAAVNSKNDDASAELMSKARAALVMGKSAKAAFFATLALKKKLLPQRGLGTMMTDGQHIFYDPDWVVKYSLAEVVTIICHECMHTAQAHHARIGTRNAGLWNVACDLAINPILRNTGFTMPAGALMPNEGKYSHVPDDALSAEAIYPYLLKPPPPPSEDEEPPPPGSGGSGDGDEGQDEEPSPDAAPAAPGPGDGKPHGTPGIDPGKTGGVQPPPDRSAAGIAEAEANAQMELAGAEQAAQLKGDIGADLKRICNDIIRPKVDWREILREFVSRRIKSDYCWSKPNRRFLSQGLYLPSRSGETLGKLALAVDCSGSIGEDVLKQFAGCLEGLIQAWPDVQLDVFYHDVPVTHRQEWTPEDGELVFSPHGGGGTSHGPVFAEMTGLDEAPVCIICLTDCYTDYPSDCEIPTLWCVVNNRNPSPPFGQVVLIED